MATRRSAAHNWRQSLSRPEWVGIAGIVAVVGVVIALLAWLLPQSSSSSADSGTSSSSPGQTTPQPTPELSRSDGAAPSSSPADRPSANKTSTDVVKIVDVSQRPGIADVTVRVSGPPSPGTQYLLVIRHNGGFQYKNDIPANVGEHVIEADLRLAPPGSWREFFVVGADTETLTAWKATAAKPAIEIPKGTRELTQRIARQLPD